MTSGRPAVHPAAVGTVGESECALFPCSVVFIATLAPILTTLVLGGVLAVQSWRSSQETAAGAYATALPTETQAALTVLGSGGDKERAAYGTTARQMDTL